MRLIGFDVDDIFLNSKVSDDYTLWYNLGEAVCPITNVLHLNIDTSRLVIDRGNYLSKDKFFVGYNSNKNYLEVKNNKVRSRDMLFLGMSSVNLSVMYPNVKVYVPLKNKRVFPKSRVLAIGYDRNINKLKYAIYVPRNGFLAENNTLYDSMGRLSNEDTSYMLQMNFKELMDLSIRSKSFKLNN